MEYNKKIDGYSIFEEQSKGTQPEERLKDVIITYYSDNKYFADSPRFTRIPEERIERAKQKLFEYTLQNMNENSIARVMPFVTIVNEVERIILNEK